MVGGGGVGGSLRRAALLRNVSVLSKNRYSNLLASSGWFIGDGLLESLSIMALMQMEASVAKKRTCPVNHMML